jgi:hypothetical protein
MTGLDLESFLRLQRADLGAWALLGLGALVLGLLVWVSWGSRRALRKCLALSLIVHAGLALYGSTVPSVFRIFRAGLRNPAEGEHIRRIRISPAPKPTAVQPILPASAPDAAAGPKSSADGKGSGPGPSLDLAAEPLLLAESRPSPRRSEGVRPDRSPDGPPAGPLARSPLPLATAIPVVALPARSAAAIRRGEANPSAAQPPPIGPTAAPTAAEIARLVPEVRKLREATSATRSSAGSSTSTPFPLVDLRRGASRERVQTDPAPRPTMGSADPLPLARATPGGSQRERAGTGPGLADLSGSSGGRNLTEVPSIYRPRLDANRSALAQRSGASLGSEQAVERALDWLARHQDADGRWDGGTARYEDGSAVPGDDDFTVHCPPGQTCFGECAYWEADTALTGLALLTYLGAGYTHKEGKHATTVDKGLDFLLAQQKPDGDLRGSSKAVGMYCHAMATLALCEAYALSLDDRLRDPAERAVSFLVGARARDGQAWRYLPGAPVGDTSILGWVVMALKSAREIGLRIPSQAAVGRGTLLWLDRVAAGQEKGLARYQPLEPVTATMTAEAWVCRQFLGAGGPGPASSEAATYLLQHESDRGDSNFYYWYYGTLAMYQHGGQPWTRWNERVRDRIVGLQRTFGHQAGSWDPDDSMYGARGGRIYCTTLAALSLEVYYRYLRLYDTPDLPSNSGQ